MKASEKIRDAMTRVDQLRHLTTVNPALTSALHEVKTWQSKRFANTYQDLLASEDYAGCARFFLEKLYSERDYTHRDAQFAKVAGAIELTFPEHVVEIAVSLAELHETTERLDHTMASFWIRSSYATPNERYMDAWRRVGEPETRYWQLQTVLHIGQKLTELTKKRGLRVLLKVMRRPAELMGLGDLQTFLETGFDRFGNLAKTDDQAKRFLTTINERELKWITGMFEQEHPD